MRSIIRFSGLIICLLWLAPVEAATCRDPAGFEAWLASLKREAALVEVVLDSGNPRRYIDHHRNRAGCPLENARGFLMRNAPSARMLVTLIISCLCRPALAKDINCDEQSKKGDICLCKISDLHPTQASVGMAEVRIKAERLKNEIQRRSERDFLKYLLKHNKEEPIIIGPGGIFYITDHHHLARALYDVGASQTYCTIVDNLSDAKPDDFWKHLEENNEVYLKDQNGNPIPPRDLPASVKDLSNNPFRSLAGAVRESCGFEKGDKSSSGEDYLEFQWADYLRIRWAQTGIAPQDIDTRFEGATIAALHLAAQKDAASLPGYTGKVSCN